MAFYRSPRLLFAKASASREKRGGAKSTQRNYQLLLCAYVFKVKILTEKPVFSATAYLLVRTLKLIMDDAKRHAGEWSARYVQDGMVVGLGTGTTVFYAIQKIGDL